MINAVLNPVRISVGFYKTNFFVTVNFLHTSYYIVVHAHMKCFFFKFVIMIKDVQNINLCKFQNICPSQMKLPRRLKTYINKNIIFCFCQQGYMKLQ